MLSHVTLCVCMCTCLRVRLCAYTRLHTHTHTGAPGARAIENQSYIIAPAQHGQHSANRASYGHSVIIDPWGRVLAEIDDGDGYAIASVDPAEVRRVREQLPSLKNRQPFT